MMNEKKKIYTAGYIVVAITIITLIAIGFGSEVKKVTSCTAIAQKYIIAEFSETSLQTTTDVDGNLDTYLDTDYWQEPASDVWIIYTKNGNIDTYIPHVVRDGIAFPVYPQINVNYKGSPNFDRYSKKSSSSYEVGFGDGDYFTDPISIHTKCMESLNKIVPVKTWWGIKYSSNFTG